MLVQKQSLIAKLEKQLIFNYIIEISSSAQGCLHCQITIFFCIIASLVPLTHVI